MISCDVVIESEKTYLGVKTSSLKLLRTCFADVRLDRTDGLLLLNELRATRDDVLSRLVRGLIDSHALETSLDVLLVGLNVLHRLHLSFLLSELLDLGFSLYFDGVRSLQ